MFVFADLLEKYHSGKLEEWREKSLDFFARGVEWLTVWM